MTLATNTFMLSSDEVEAGEGLPEFHDRILVVRLLGPANRYIKVVLDPVDEVG